MKKMKSDTFAYSLERMQAAKHQLAAGRALLHTSEVVERSIIPLCADTLLEYPRWIMPRVPKNPKAKRPTYLFDPRDVLDLPRVLTAWEAAIGSGREDEFARERMTYLIERDMPAQEAA